MSVDHGVGGRHTPVKMPCAHCTSQVKLNVAAIIEAAAPVIFPGDEFRQAGLRQSWNILSSDAHVLFWSLAMRMTFDTPADSLTGLSTGKAGGQGLRDLAGLVQPGPAQPALRLELVRPQPRGMLTFGHQLAAPP